MKTIPFTAAHSHIAHIWQYSHPHLHPRPFIHSFHQDLFPTPPPKKKFTYSCKRSLKFLLGITVIPREIKDNSYQAKFWGVNKVHCGQHEKSEKPTKCILSRSLLSFLVLVKIIFRLNLFNLQSATKLLKHCT